MGGHQEGFRKEECLAVRQKQRVGAAGYKCNQFYNFAFPWSLG